VLYRSGQLLDLARLARAARARGIIIGFDCSHSVGAVPHQLHDWDVDFAVWCSYKYLNGGPGCSAFLYLHERHFHRRPGLSGWFGVDKQSQFALSLDFEQAATSGGWQISSPGILGSATIEGALAVFGEAGIDQVRTKSLQLTEYLMFLADAAVSDATHAVRVGTPREAARRGGHVALERDADAARIVLALRARGFVPDYRPPNIIRVAPVALYNSFSDVWRFVQALKEIIRSGEYAKYDPEQVEIT
jgi:kynureninase